MEKIVLSLSKHFSVTLLQCNIIAALGVLIVGGATKIGNRMEIIPIIISMYISKMMAITLIMTAITIEIAIIH